LANLFFIGTGSGKTSVDRFHSSFLINTSGYNLLIDAGDGISKALHKQGVEFNPIDGVLITHLHPDHYTGLASLIVQMKMYGRKKDLNIYINSCLEEAIKNFITNSYLFPDKLGFGINYHSFQNNVQIRVSDEINFLPRENSHLALVSELKKNTGLYFSSSSFLFDIRDKKILYTSDIGSEEDLHLFDDYTPDYFISEITHIKPEEVVNKSIQFEINPGLIFTHYSDEDVVDVQNYISNLSDELKSRVILANDGLNIDL